MNLIIPIDDKPIQHSGTGKPPKNHIFDLSSSPEEEKSMDLVSPKNETETTIHQLANNQEEDTNRKKTEGNSYWKWITDNQKEIGIGFGAITITAVATACFSKYKYGTFSPLQAWKIYKHRKAQAIKA